MDRPMSRLKGEKLLSRTLMAVWITFMEHFFWVSFWPFILICLVHSPCLVFLRFLPCVPRHVLAKTESIEEAVGNLAFSSVQFSRSVVSDSLWPHESQSMTGACQASLSITNSQSSLRLTSIESVMPASHLILGHPLLLLPLILPASGSFPMSQLFTWGGQSTGPSALASFLLKKSQGWSPSERTGWISLQSKGLSRVFSNTTVQKHQGYIHLSKHIKLKT